MRYDKEKGYFHKNSVPISYKRARFEILSKLLMGFALAFFLGVIIHVGSFVVKIIVAVTIFDFIKNMLRLKSINIDQDHTDLKDKMDLRQFEMESKYKKTGWKESDLV
jgi:hypothetical protein